MLSCNILLWTQSNKALTLVAKPEATIQRLADDSQPPGAITAQLAKLSSPKHTLKSKQSSGCRFPRRAAVLARASRLHICTSLSCSLLSCHLRCMLMIDLPPKPPSYITGCSGLKHMCVSVLFQSCCDQGRQASGDDIFQTSGPVYRCVHCSNLSQVLPSTTANQCFRLRSPGTQ